MNETVFERELKSFKAHLTQSEQNNFAGTTIKDLHLTIAGIQKTQLSDRTNKNVKRLRTFLEAVESLTKVLDIFVNVNDFVAFVWGPVKFLLLVGLPKICCFAIVCAGTDVRPQQNDILTPDDFRPPANPRMHLLHYSARTSRSAASYPCSYNIKPCFNTMITCERF